jgi:ubiquinone/menaquinone biosynthesis C-methylase UbiE
VAAGTGNAAVPAALSGAHVTASDVTPELFPAGRAFAARHGVEIAFEEGDAQALPYPDGAFDTVLSCIGAMFAADHRRTADELVRTVRPGGRIGLLNWAVDGFVGDLFRAMGSHTPAPPQSPALWGDEAYVRELLGERVRAVAVTRGSVQIDRFATAEAWLEYWKRTYGPTIMAYRAVADPAALDRDLLAVARKHTVDSVMTWEYVVVTCVKKD